MQEPLGFAFEPGSTREVTGIDLGFEFADGVVQTLQQLFVQRVARSVVLHEALAHLIGVT